MRSKLLSVIAKSPDVSYSWQHEQAARDSGGLTAMYRAVPVRQSDISPATRVFISDEPQRARQKASPVYETKLGVMYHGTSQEALKFKKIERSRGSVQLLFTSPPFPLARGKDYGNLNGEAYVEWLASYARLFREYLKPNGSIVMEVGNAWEPGRPVMSTVVLQALLRFLQEGGLHLCEEFIWYNPARLPSPVQWVNVERIRVKDSFTRIWWMSPSERPKADNRRILREYSEGMRALLKRGTYNSGKRPSEHNVGETSFTKDNGGAIPSNVFGGDDAPPLSNFLKESNTHSAGQYHLFCKQYGIPKHPARMPEAIVEYFIKFLTEPGDLVLDPFAGSNTTGYVAERLKRRWIGIEDNWTYIRGSLGRFPAEDLTWTSDEIIFVNGAPVAPPDDPLWCGA